MKFMRENIVSIGIVFALVVIFGLQCQMPDMTASLAVTEGSGVLNLLTGLIAHGSILHLSINCMALVIILAGFGPQRSAALIAWALPAAVAAEWLYSSALMPHHAWMCGSSPLIFALFGLIAWQERRTSVFSLFGISRLSLPPIQMLGVMLVCDAVFAHLLFAHVAWPVHTLSGLGGLMTGMVLSLRPLWKPRYAMALIFLSAALVILFGSGCVSGNKGVEVKVEHQRTSTIAENIDAAGRVAGGAFDRIFGKGQ